MGGGVGGSGKAGPGSPTLLLDFHLPPMHTPCTHTHRPAASCLLTVTRHSTKRQTIEHPSNLWDVAFLPNGDLVTACSDHVARVWTQAPERAAAAEAAQVCGLGENTRWWCNGCLVVHRTHA